MPEKVIIWEMFRAADAGPQVLLEQAHMRAHITGMHATSHYKRESHLCEFAHSAKKSFRLAKMQSFHQAYRSPARTSIAAQKTHSSNTQGDFPQNLY